MEKNKLDRRQIILASTSHGVTDLYSSFIIGLIPILVAKFGLSLFLVALLTSINGISNSLTQPIFGYFSDKYGLKYFLAVGPLFASIFLSMLGIVPNYLFILIILFLGNLSVSAFHPPSAAIAGHFGGKRKGFGVSIIALGGIIGYSFGSIFIILVVEKIGLNFTPITMIPGIIMSIILLKYIPSTLTTVNSTRKIHFISKLRNVKKSKLFFLLHIPVIWYGFFYLHLCHYTSLILVSA
jgi:FSR family fosmidomycin resistance protein-like MFS transporter